MLDYNELEVNFVVAVIIGLLSFLWTRFGKAIRQRMFQRKYRIAGNYLSYFEDTGDNQIVWAKATLQVRQKGPDVTATGIDLLKKRDTLTRAKVLKNGSIVGTYGRRNPLDPAKGVVFLEPDPVTSGLYRGFYAGYDSTTRRLVSGRYVWRRLLVPRVSMIRGDSTERLVAQSLLGDFLGNRYTDSAAFEQAMHEGSNKAVLVARDNERVVGAVVVDSTPEFKMPKLDHQVPGTQRLRNPALHCAGMVHAVAVAEGSRDRGVGTTLIRAAEEYLRRRSCTAVYSVVWRTRTAGDGSLPTRDDIPALGAPRNIDWGGAAPDELASAAVADPARLLLTEGYFPLGRLADVTPPPGGCSDCAEPCICEGWLYFRNLSA